MANALAASAGKFRRQSSFKNVEANLAATRGGHERRKQEWHHQQGLAALEEKQFDDQLVASGVRIEQAQKELDAHDRQSEQSAELHELYRNKFTNLGLYAHLASSMSRLFREVYNLAHDMAMKAQRAYQFETDDQTFFIANDNWQADKAGLLAGERLTLQLQTCWTRLMSNRHPLAGRSDVAVFTSSIDPRALIDLRETGRCDFSVPEIWSDLYYPGQYKRGIKSVRLTIPCVTGPYTNVSAKMTLTGSRMRTEPQLTAICNRRPHQRNTSVATRLCEQRRRRIRAQLQGRAVCPVRGGRGGERLASRVAVCVSAVRLRQHL